MGWDKNLEDKFRWFNFDGNWKLYTSASKKVINLLEEIDIFVYPLGHRFRESWGRSTAEAMLSGCPVVVPSGDHHFINFIQHGKTGFIYKTYEECRQICQFLEQNPNTRKEVGIAARDYLIQNVFNIEEHTKKWKEVFDA
jgi:glycosyltransferase involved in cell wall biosynthesis